MAPPNPWGADDRLSARVARNVSTRYLVIGVDIVIGLVLLPFNLAYLGKATYGVWMLAASLTQYFNILDFGYGSAAVKYVAQYRARRDAAAVNQIVSTLFVLFGAIGLLVYAAAAIIAFNLGTFLRLTPEEIDAGRWVLLIVSLQVAAGFPFSVYGAVINGFQRYDANSIISIASSIAVAVVNVAVLLAGYGLIELVVATTGVRILTLFVYRANAYRIFPLLRVRPGLFRRERLREVTGFSFYALLIDTANKLNYSVSPVIVGGFIGAAAVTVWTVGQRISMYTQQLTNQLNTVLFPTIVDSDVGRRRERLRTILIEGTRLSLVTVVPIAGTMAVLAEPIVIAWVGAQLLPSVVLIQILMLATAIRVGVATAMTVLKGIGEHKVLAWVNFGSGVANVALAVVLIGPYGLPGVAWAWLLTITPASVFFLFPLACRRVGLSIPDVLSRAVWPTIWPIGPVALPLYLAGRSPDWPVLLAVAGTGLVIYLALFYWVAISREDRRIYAMRIREILHLVRPPVAASSASGR